MSQVEKRKSITVDPEAEQQEATRRAELGGNNAYRRGVLAAQAQERANVQSALTTALADLKRVSLKRDTTVAARDAYDRCYSRVVKAAERAALALVGSIGEDGKVITGPKITIPAWLPPPTPAAEQTVSIGAPRADASYRESKGMGKSGRGGPAPGESGTDAHEAWLNVQGAK